MKRLARTSLYTKDQGLEVRVEQLERRIIQVPVHWAQVRFSNSQAVTSGGTLLSWQHFRTTNQLVFSTSATAGGAINNTAGDLAIRMDAAGIVFVDCWIEFQSGTFYRTVHLNWGGGETDAISNWNDLKSKVAYADTSVDSDGNVLGVTDGKWIQAGDDTSPSWFTSQANVGAAQPNKNAIGGVMTVVLFQPSGVLWDNTVVY